MLRCQCPSVCDGSALGRGACRERSGCAMQPAKLKPSYDPQQTWPPPMEGSSRAVLATARPSCCYFLHCLLCCKTFGSASDRASFRLFHPGWLGCWQSISHSFQPCQRRGLELAQCATPLTLRLVLYILIIIII